MNGWANWLCWLEIVEGDSFLVSQVAIPVSLPLQTTRAGVRLGLRPSRAPAIQPGTVAAASSFGQSGEWYAPHGPDPCPHGSTWYTSGLREPGGRRSLGWWPSRAPRY